MRSIARTLALRLAEPSSWAGIGAVLAASGYVLPSDLAHSIALFGAGAAGLIAFCVPESS